MSDSANEKLIRLADAFLSLNDREECLCFFEDLFTTKEIVDFSARLEVARLLKARVNYIDIANQTGASTATISRVSKSLVGKSGGYRTVLSRLEKECDDDATVIKLNGLSENEAAAVRAVVACLRAKK